MKPKNLKESDGARRRAHFGALGTPETWRPRPRVLDESGSKARRSKRMCRVRFPEDGW